MDRRDIREKWNVALMGIWMWDWYEFGAEMKNEEIIEEPPFDKESAIERVKRNRNLREGT